MTRESSLTLGAVALLLCACTSTTERPDPPRREETPSVTRTITVPAKVVDLAGVDFASLKRLPTTLPRRLPAADVAIPSLLDDPPGRAVMVYHPREMIGEIRASWAEIHILFLGADGKWRRLNMADLGLSEDLLYHDTYGAGALSGDGRTWAGATHRGVVLVDLMSGTHRLLDIPRWGGRVEWMPGNEQFQVNKATVDVDDGEVHRVPYDSWQVGHEPDGTPLSVVRGRDGLTRLVEWDGSRQTVRATVPLLRLSDTRPTGVEATRGQFARVVGGSDATGLVTVDSATGDVTARMRDVRGYNTTHGWLDERTFLIQTRRHLLAWHPAGEKVYRVTDAAPSSGYWSIDIATDVASK